MDFIECSSISNMCVKNFALYNEQRVTGELCDIAIVADGRKLNAHKLILSSGAPFFRKMFTVSMTEADMKEININYETIEKIIDFIYTGKARISSETAQNLLIAANYLQMEELIDLCGKYIFNQIDDANCFSMRNFLKTINCVELGEKAQDYINRNFNRIINDTSFMQLDIDNVVEVLSSSEVYCDSEEDVCHGAVRWLNAHVDPSKYAQRVLQCIRLPLLDDTFKSEFVFENSVFSRDNIENAVFSDKLRNFHSVIVTLRFLEDTVVLYDTSAKEWTQLLKLPKPYQHILSKKDELIFAGKHFEAEYIDVFNLRTKQWRTLSVLPYKIIGSARTITIVVDKIYIFSNTVQNWTAHVFDMTTNIWMKMTDFEDELASLDVVTIDRYIYVFTTSREKVLKLQRLDTTTQTWVDLQTMTIERHVHGVTAYKGKIYVAGGFTWPSQDERNWLESMEVYDPAKNEWKDLSPMLSEMKYTKLIATTEGIFAMRSNGFGCLKTEFYNVEEDKWSIDSTFRGNVCFKSCTV